MHVDEPHAHKIARFPSRQVVRAERNHPPEVVLLLSSTQATDCKTRNVAFCHFCEESSILKYHLKMIPQLHVTGITLA